jgi:hypothetical protein
MGDPPRRWSAAAASAAWDQLISSLSHEWQSHGRRQPLLHLHHWVVGTQYRAVLIQWVRNCCAPELLWDCEFEFLMTGVSFDPKTHSAFFVIFVVHLHIANQNRRHGIVRYMVKQNYY